MSISSPSGVQPSRESPSVGGYRRGFRARTTVAGTWFPAVAPDDTPAGLLLLHPAVLPAALTTAAARLAALDLPGVLPIRPDLVEQAGRHWLVADMAITPTVADLLDDGPHRTPANAAALLAEVADTLAEAHAAGLAHGAVGAHAVVVGPAGTALLLDWGTDEHAGPESDRAAWAAFADLLAERWCAGSPAEAALITGAARAAGQPGPDGGLDAALEWLDELAERADRDSLVAAAATPAAPRRRPADDPARRAAAIERDTEDASPSPRSPSPSPSPPSVRRRRPSRPVLLAAVAGVLAAALVAVVVMAVRPSTPEPDARAYGPLEVRAVRVIAEVRSPLCVAVATVSTNGRPGRVAYRWVGENGAQAVSTVSGGTDGRVEIGIVWRPGASPVNGNTVTLQILEPAPSTTSARIPLDCI